jgi:hypothetical protein
MWKEVIVAEFDTIPEFSWRDWENQEIPQSQQPNFGRYLNLGPPEYKSGQLPTQT